jgi:hypothetical protein
MFVELARLTEGQAVTAFAAKRKRVSTAKFLESRFLPMVGYF